jgi:hypothetical protein
MPAEILLERVSSVLTFRAAAARQAPGYLASRQTHRTRSPWQKGLTSMLEQLRSCKITVSLARLRYRQWLGCRAARGVPSLVTRDQHEVTLAVGPIHQRVNTARAALIIHLASSLVPAVLIRSSSQRPISLIR